METTKMTVRVPKALLDEAKRYARENDMTLTRLITLYLDRLASERQDAVDAPTVARLAGSLSPDVSVADHKRYLAEKYGVGEPDTP